MAKKKPGPAQKAPRKTPTREQIAAFVEEKPVREKPVEPKYARMTVYLDKDMIMRCKRLALDRGRTASEVIREALKRYLDSNA